MSSGSGRFLRENPFLVAAISLPVAIVALFLLLSAIPRWTVPPPAHDVLLRTSVYDYTGAGGVSVEFVVQEERLHAIAREVPATSYPHRSHLWLVDHRTMNARQISIKIPQLVPGEKEKTVPVEALADRRVLAEAKAPDGYEVRNRNHGGGGLFADLFGMGRHGSSVTLVNRSRVIKLSIPPSNDYQSAVFVGWVVDEGTH